MSGDRIVAGPEGTMDMDQYDGSSRQPVYKSYKKKYRKMRHLFEEKMKESNALFKEEQKAMETARRLQEKNDQLLDLLLDLNESSHLAPQYRYDLESPSLDPAANLPLSPTSPPPSPTAISAARTALEQAKADLESGALSPNSYSQKTTSLNERINKSTSLRSILSIPHTTLASLDADTYPDELLSPTGPGYLTPTHEEEYLLTLDASIGGRRSPSLALATSRHSALSSRIIDKAFDKDRDKDFAVRNPVSVYNWLRKHQPQVFLQDNELGSEKSAPRASTKDGKSNPDTTGSTRSGEKSSTTTNNPASTTAGAPERSSKRNSLAPSSAVAAPKPDPDAFDDDIFMHEVPAAPSSRGKRKKEDEAYRPKGGSSRSSKRKRDDSERAAAKKVRKIAAASGPGSS
ncbi:MAG: hypothetical protein M1819_000836 [Sarea resinae]|nr:MAG: hypothetical protein M1819_000836 [Sarea resinae]